MFPARGRLTETMASLVDQIQMFPALAWMNRRLLKCQKPISNLPSTRGDEEPLHYPRSDLIFSSSMTGLLTVRVLLFFL